MSEKTNNFIKNYIQGKEQNFNLNTSHVKVKYL